MGDNVIEPPDAGNVIVAGFVSCPAPYKSVNPGEFRENITLSPATRPVPPVLLYVIVNVTLVLPGVTDVIAKGKALTVTNRYGSNQSEQAIPLLLTYTFYFLNMHSVV